jgi:hypothetical protein
VKVEALAGKGVDLAVDGPISYAYRPSRTRWQMVGVPGVAKPAINCSTTRRSAFEQPRGYAVDRAGTYSRTVRFTVTEGV